MSQAQMGAAGLAAGLLLATFVGWFAQNPDPCPVVADVSAERICCVDNEPVLVRRVVFDGRVLQQTEVPNPTPGSVTRVTLTVGGRPLTIFLTSEHQHAPAVPRQAESDGDKIPGR
jgi:hypothetical protein